jgi:acetyl-CoA acetyltransferase
MLDAVIVGYGQTEYHKRPVKSTAWYTIDAVARALAQCGLTPRDVDGLGVSSFLLPPDNTATMCEQLGIQARWTFWGTNGGASHVVAILEAAKAIERGDAETVVLVAADAYSVGKHNELMDHFNTGMQDYLAPFGFGGTNGLFAMLQRRHSYEYGTTREQLGKLAVTQRANASLNENALLRAPMTMEDYLTCRPICEPLGLFDCVLPCGGGEATVIVSAERAKTIHRPPVRVLSGAQRTNHGPDETLNMRGGWTEFHSQMFEDAGLTHDDVDLLELYDDYPIMEVVQIEGLGFCGEGEGGLFVANTDISLQGTLPINTGGGQLSCGQSGAGGGAIAVTEAILQLQREAGDRQVADPTTALVSGFGMVGYGKGLCASAVFLSI